MIDGAEHFHYLGLTRRNNSVMMVFQEGMLILDRNQPGWGAMPPATLAQRVSDLPGRSPSDSDASDSGGDDPSGSDSDVFDSFSDGPLSTSSSAAATPSHSATPSPAGSRAGTPASSVPASPRDASADGSTARLHSRWSPSRELLGWHPCEALVFVGPVTLKAVGGYKALGDAGELQAFVAQLKQGRWAPQPAGSPGDATMVVVQMFGQLQGMVWDGIWHAAGNGEHQQHGMTATRACQLAASAVVADACSLAPVPHAERSDYLAHVQSGAVSVMVFSLGLLVRSHPEPALVGWHDLDDTSRGAFVTPADANIIELMCRSNYPRENSMFQTFFIGMMDVSADEGPFVAAIRSHKARRWFHLRLDMPHVQLPDDPEGPSPAAVIKTLQEVRLAPLHDRQTPDAGLHLCSGRWQVPLFLGAIQCLDASVDVPGMIAARWHGSLQPVIEKHLLAHRQQEHAWLTSGVIRQPIDPLIDLMRRDLNLRRAEVWVMWPVELLQELFTALAPREKVRVITSPKAADVDQALDHHACTLFVFQTPGHPEQSVVLAQGNTCWSGEQRLKLPDVKARVARALAPGATEHLLALACVVQ